MRTSGWGGSKVLRTFADKGGGVDIREWWYATYIKGRGLKWPKIYGRPLWTAPKAKETLCQDISIFNWLTMSTPHRRSI